MVIVIEWSLQSPENTVCDEISWFMFIIPIVTVLLTRTLSQILWTPPYRIDLVRVRKLCGGWISIVLNKYVLTTFISTSLANIRDSWCHQHSIIVHLVLPSFLILIKSSSLSVPSSKCPQVPAFSILGRIPVSSQRHEIVRFPGPFFSLCQQSYTD